MRLWLIGLGVAGAAAAIAAAGSSSTSGSTGGKSKAKPKGPKVSTLDKEGPPWKTIELEYTGIVETIDTGKAELPHLPIPAGLPVPVIGPLLDTFAATWLGIVKAVGNKKRYTTSPGELRPFVTHVATGPIRFEAVVTWGELHDDVPSPPCASQTYATEIADAPEALELPFSQDDPDTYPSADPGKKWAKPPQNAIGVCQHHDLDDLAGAWVHPPGPQEPRIYAVKVGSTWTFSLWIPGRAWSWWYAITFRTLPA